MSAAARRDLTDFGKDPPATEEELDQLKKSAENWRKRQAEFRATTREIADESASFAERELQKIEGVLCLDDQRAWILQMKVEAEDHTRTCVSEFCEPCGRPACTKCWRTAVPKRDDICFNCLIGIHMREIGIPRRYKDVGFYDPARTIYSRVFSAGWVKLASQSVDAHKIVFRGPAGVGKSTLLSAAGAQRKANGLKKNRNIDVRWVSAIDIGEAQRRHKLGSESEAELIEDACDADLLLIDDLGAEGARDVEAICKVIHHRHDRDRDTWISTALSASEIGLRYSGGIERRIFEGAVIIGGVDP